MTTFVKLRCPNNVSGKVVANKETEEPAIVPDLSQNMPENEQILGTQEKVLETQEEAQINRSLPGEMLEMVFRHLPPKDLKVAVMVCKWWDFILILSSMLAAHKCTDLNFIQV